MNAEFFPFFPSLSRDNLPKRMEAWAKLPPEYHSFVQCHLLYVIASKMSETQRSAAQLLETHHQMLQVASSLAEQLIEQAVDNEPSAAATDPNSLVKLLLSGMESDAQPVHQSENAANE